MFSCIKKKCPYYFQSDIVEKCKLANQYMQTSECIGLSHIDTVKSELACQISKLTKQWNELSELKSTITKKRR